MQVSALADDGKNKVLLEIGTLSSDVDTELRIDGASGRFGTVIDLEDDLGFETSKQINRLDFRYRFTPKHSLKYSFFQLDRNARYVIDRTIVIGETEYMVNADIRAGFDYLTHSVSYGYSLRSDEQSDLDLLAGLYYVKTGLSVLAVGTGEFEDFDGAGPLPLVGLNYERTLSGKWSLAARGTVFKLDIDDYNGSLVDARLRVDYRITERFGLGLAYNWQRLNAGVKDDKARGDFDMTMSGFELVAVLRF
jgi:hypothetical protein